tara:strand:+ start:113 stop:397 length:285 start_codon:yes stop_codon:yes gene_type:complete
MFSANSFSEASFSELDTPIVASGITGGDVVIYFNNSYMTFPLEINTQADLSLDINTSQDHSLGINTQADLDIDINTQQDHSLGINKTLDFNAER